MANTIITKNSSTASAVPTSGDLVQGELAVNVTDKRLFTENSGGTVVEVGTNPSTIAVAGNATVGGTLGVTGLATLASSTLTANPTLSAGTANGVTYLNGSKVLTSGSALTFDGTTFQVTGKIAVSGTNPSIRQTVQNSQLDLCGGTTVGTDPSIQMVGSTNSGGDANSVFQNTNTHVFRNTAGSSEYMRLNSTGLGIGTSSPSAKLHINDSTGSAVTLLKMQTGWDNPSGNKSMVWSDNTGDLGRISVSYSSPQAKMTFGSLYNSGYQSSDLMTLTADGNVGIGTSPARKLSVSSGSTSATYFQLCNTTSGTGVGQGFELFSDGTNAGVINRQNGYLEFDTNNIERARITSAGDLLVGTTSVIQAGKYSSSFNGAISNGIVLQTTYASTGTDFVRCVNSAGTAIGNITQNGASTVAYNTSSDYRLKNTIATMTGALAKVALLKPCTYKWNADGSDGEGFIAHELQEVCPSAVTGEKDAVNEDGSIKPQGIDTSFLVATLTAAIQEQQAIIESLTARVSALEGN
jgi:hypothetical protein